MDHIERYNCSTRLRLLRLGELEEKLSLASIWMDIKVKIRGLLDYEDEGQLKFDLSMHKQMLRDHSYRVPIYNKLSELNVPADIQPSVTHDILIQSSFLTIAPEIVNADCKVLHMAVSIDVVHVNDPKFGPVSKFLIASLEKTKVKVSTMCSFCLEEIMVGSEATRMPCSHLYHGDCIVDWLQKNRFCPLCHFAKPTH